MTLTTRWLAFALCLAVYVWLYLMDYDRTMTVISWTMTAGIVGYALYQWAQSNLAKAREHDEELR